MKALGEIFMRGLVILVTIEVMAIGIYSCILIYHWAIKV